MAHILNKYNDIFSKKLCDALNLDADKTRDIELKASAGSITHLKVTLYPTNDELVEVANLIADYEWLLVNEKEI